MEGGTIGARVFPPPSFVILSKKKTIWVERAHGGSGDTPITGSASRIVEADRSSIPQNPLCGVWDVLYITRRIAGDVYKTHKEVDEG
jgi:hypothetical protein